MMNGPDDSNRERPDRPTNPPQSRPGAEENGHAIPFGEGVYGLGGVRKPEPELPKLGNEPDQVGNEPDQPYGEPPPGEPPPAHRTSRSTPYSEGSGTFGDEPGPDRERSPDFDFRRLAAELGFEGHTEGRQCVGFCPICRSADLLRSVTTPELRAAWTEFQRELARALRVAAERYAAPQADDRAERITEIPID